MLTQYFLNMVTFNLQQEIERLRNSDDAQEKNMVNRKHSLILIMQNDWALIQY